MKRALLGFAITAYSAVSFAQADTKVFGYQSENPGTICLTNNGGAIVGGTTLAYFSTVDSLDWIKSPGSSEVIQTNDGHYLTIGLSSNLIKFTDTATIIWSKYHSGFSMLDIVQLSDSSFVTIGGNSTMSNVTLGWFDKSGNLVSVGEENDDGFGIRSLSIDANSNDDIFLGITDHHDNPNFVCRVVKMKPDGSYSWIKKFSSDLNITIQDIHHTNDGGVVVLMEGAQGDDGYEVLLMKLDSNGDSDWMKQYGTIGNDRPTSLDLFDDESIIVVGSTDFEGIEKGLSGCDGEATPCPDGMMIQTDDEGNIEWAHYYGDSYRDKAQAVVTQGNSDFYVAGITKIQGISGVGFLTQKSKQEHQLCNGLDFQLTTSTRTVTLTTGTLTQNPIGSTNSTGQVLGNGFPHTDKDYCDFVYPKGLEDIEGANFQLWPNPATYSIFISTESSKSVEVTIIDLLGKIVKQSNLKASQNQLDISDLTAGIYLVSIKDEDHIMTERLVVK